MARAKKSRNYLFSTIRDLRLSRDNWRRKCELLKAENKKLKNQLRHLTKPAPRNKEEMLKELSKHYGWQAWKDKYET
jgi:hypothetical protein